MAKFKNEFNDGSLNGAVRYYNTYKGAIIAAKNYVRTQNKKWSSCNPYVYIFMLDATYKPHLLTTIEV